MSGGRTMSAGATAPRDVPHILVVDNYDSFTYNLVQCLGELGAEVTVRRNDQTTPDGIAAARPSHLVVSPGPCTPDRAGISMDAIRHLGGLGVPVLGVCLGHQAIGQAFGGVVRRAAGPVHGKTDEIHHDGRGHHGGFERQSHDHRTDNRDVCKQQGCRFIQIFPS